MQKIFFNDHYSLTQAVLNGTKTMTRRVIPSKVVEYALTTYRQEYYSAALDYLDDYECLVGYLIVEKNTRYKLGEVVAVAQSYNTICTDFEKLNEVKCMCGRDVTKDKSWTNKMFVKPSLMPHQIKITDVRIERLQAISDDDCLKEGVFDSNVGYNRFGFRDKHCDHNWYYPTPREAFAALINRPGVGRKGLWELNPWVICYSFKLVK